MNVCVCVNKRACVHLLVRARASVPQLRKSMNERGEAFCFRASFLSSPSCLLHSDPCCHAAIPLWSNTAGANERRVRERVLVASQIVEGTVVRLLHEWLYSTLPIADHQRFHSSEGQKESFVDVRIQQFQHCSKLLKALLPLWHVSWSHSYANC